MRDNTTQLFYFYSRLRPVFALPLLPLRPERHARRDGIYMSVAWSFASLRSASWTNLFGSLTSFLLLFPSISSVLKA